MFPNVIIVNIPKAVPTGMNKQLIPAMTVLKVLWVLLEIYRPDIAVNIPVITLTEIHTDPITVKIQPMKTGGMSPFDAQLIGEKTMDRPMKR